jgi:hypothetical protein
MHFHITDSYVLSRAVYARVQIHTTYNYMDLNNITHIFWMVNCICYIIIGVSEERTASILRVHQYKYPKIGSSPS